MKIEIGKNGGGLGVLLFITFLVLKLTKVISWSWWWITAPLWGPLVLFLICMSVMMTILFIGGSR